MTGTPSGVGPLRSGDRIKAGLEDIEMLEFDVRSG
jgi:2-keto-4-pentenoate hydratase/2-oxohepta-3-ene-1,7-dioic acid hydratase in catechol pathway